MKKVNLTNTVHLAIVFISASFISTAQSILVPPYLQPGNAPTLNKEQKVIIWQTDSVPGNYLVEFGMGDSFEGIEKITASKISSVELHLNNKTTLLYRAVLMGLQFDSQYSYKVSLNDKELAKNSFSTRSKKALARFAVFGDCGAGTSQHAQIAYQVFLQKPQFVLVTGDNVYTRGLEREYRKNFFPAYLSPEASAEKGAPLMSTLPFYMIVGNHDTYGSNLDKFSDGLAYYYYSDLPVNAPVPQSTIEVSGAAERVKEFKKNTKGRFPQMSNYSFDQGNVHITCLDANDYVNPLDPQLVQWIKDDIRNSKADWKIVAYHHPAFNSSKAHYDDQWMRLLCPLVEELKVDLVLTGHVHNYQRTVPLSFAPKLDESGTHYTISKEGRVDGKFTLDNDFDGVTKTKPKGIVYIVTGAGGAGLYDKEITNRPELWKHEPQDNWVPFTVKIISDRHSFTFIETDESKLVLKQLDANGVTLDEIKITR